jgi:uncharacterized protein (DUF427 family)
MTSGHQVTITPTTHHLEVTVGGQVIAVTDRPVILAETGMQPRYYVPREDVRLDLLHATDTASNCPFKGDARYWSVAVGTTVHGDVAWSYESPLPGAEGIAGLVAFYDERVEVTVDGQLAQGTPGPLPASHLPASHKPASHRP